MSHILLVNELAELRAENHRLRADAERLDWLTARRYLCYGISEMNGHWLVAVETEGYAEYGRDLREAIDAARKTKP